MNPTDDVIGGPLGAKTIQKLADPLEITVDDLLTEGGGASLSRIQDPELVELLSQIPSSVFSYWADVVRA